MGTVELTGLEMIRKQALGQLLAHCSAIPFTMEAFVLKRSSLTRNDITISNIMLRIVKRRKHVYNKTTREARSNQA